MSRQARPEPGGEAEDAGSLPYAILPYTVSGRVYNIDTRLDPDLRDIAVDPEEMRLALTEAQERLAQEPEPRTRIALLGQIGVHSRVLGDLPVAERALSEAVQLAAELEDSRLEVVNAIRLAHVHHWAAGYERAGALLDQVLTRCRRDPHLRSWTDFALQHLGKCLLDEGRVSEAVEAFEEALQLRLEKGDAELIDSTRRALERARHRDAMGRQGSSRSSASE